MRRALASLVFVVALIETAPAHADAGGRIGVTDDPDTLFFGIFGEHVLGGSRSAAFAIEPGFDLGIGEFGDEEFFTLRGTLNFKVIFAISRSAVLYPLGGLSLYHMITDGGDPTEVGGNLGFGLGFSRFNVELSAGLSDEPYPDITFSFGIFF